MADQEKTAESASTNKWWEQYYVRYFVGTVIGAVILLALRQYAHLHSDFQNVIPLSKEDVWGLAAITAAGLAYCYLASAPILTLHAVRGGLGFRKPRGLAMFAIFLVVFLGTPVLGLAIQHWLKSRAAFGWTLVLGMVTAQCAAILVAQRKGFRQIASFYDDLVAARLQEKEDGTDYRDSHRHLREHGNAKAIILLEVILGLIIASADTPQALVSMVLLWILPAAYVWFIATVLEFHFAQRAKTLPRKSPSPPGSTNTYQP